MARNQRDEARLPADLLGAFDACEDCGPDDEDCIATVPVALVGSDGPGVDLAYRCRHGHDWLTSWDRAFATGGGEVRKHWPPQDRALLG